MLERATACLKAGAKDSLRCAHPCHHHAPSKRLLHQTFWTHGAGDLDLPHHAVGMLDVPPNLLLEHSGSPKPRKRRELVSTPAPAVNSDGLLLDFLYPPHALAWLQRTAGQQHWERWEKRNARRLPDGFIQASRGYSSSTYSHVNTIPAPDGHQGFEHERGDQDHTSIGTIVLEDQTKHSSDLENAHTEQRTDPHPSQATGLESMSETAPADTVSIRDPQMEDAVKHKPDELSFVGSTKDPAEVGAVVNHGKPVSTDPLHDLHSLLAGSKPPRGQDKTAWAWTLYNMLDNLDKQDARLKNELLVFFSACQNDVADAHCISLYLSMPLDARSLSTYRAVLAAFLRRNDKESALGLHQEALSNLPNSTQITTALFSYAVQNELVAMALKVKEQHDEALPSQDAIFWLHVSEMPNLTTVAARFARKSWWREKSVKSGLSKANITGLLKLSAKLSEEAINQLVLHPLPQDMVRTGLPSKIYLLCDSIHRWSPEKAPRVFEHAIISLLRYHGAQLDGFIRTPRTDFARAYHVISYMYSLYRKLETFRPSELLLTLFFNQLLHKNVTARRNRRGTHTVAMSTLVKDWKATHNKLSSSAVHRLMAFHALKGNVKELGETFQYLQQCYPSYREQKEALWSLIDVHARRADVASAIRAFGEIRRLAKANQDTVDPKWWSILINAHFHADDTDGAFITFRKMLDSGLKPSSFAITPILRMLATRGDVEGVKDLLEQYDDLSGASRNTHMASCLMIALVVNNRIQEAENVLHKAIAERRASKISGSLTLCFDVLIKAHGQRKDLDAVMRIYSWMKAENIRLTTKTYAALMRALCNYRQTNGAWKILTHALPREGLEATALHFSIVMEGYNSQGMYKRALEVHRKMLDREVKPNLAVDKAYFKARAFSEQRLRARKGQNRDEDGKPVALTHALKRLQTAVRRHDGSELAQSEQHLGSHEIAVSGASEVLGPVMLLHAKRRNLEAVEQMFELYQSKAHELGKFSGMFPMQVLEAVMSALMYAGRYKEVERYWKLAKHEADMFAAPVAVPDFRQHTAQETGKESSNSLEAKITDLSPQDVVDGAEIGFATQQAVTQGLQRVLPQADMSPGLRPVPGRRQILSTVVRYYFRSLLAQDRMADLVMTWTQLLNQGYTFDNRAWNRVIEFLCSSSPPLVLLAFTLTERFLIPNFPGWRKNTRWTPPKAARAQNLEYINARHVDTRNVLMPEYRTMQHLAAALMRLRKREASGDARRTHQLGRWIGSLAQIRQRAPYTFRHVQNMPNIDDYWQNRLLRQQRGGYNLGRR